MSEPPAESTTLRPVHVVMIFLAIATMFAVCFFTSPPGDITPDGAARWSEDSVLKSLCDALAFNYSIPTPQGHEIKALVAMVGGALAVLIAVVGRFGPRQDPNLDLDALQDDRESSGPWRGQIEPSLAAQLMLVLFVVFSFASSGWAVMPELAVSGSVVLLAYVLWAIGLRMGLSAAAGVIVAAGMVAALASAAALAVWYYYERNRSMRVGYPIGNPLFLGASMIPAIAVCVGWLISGLADHRAGRPLNRLRLGGAALALVPICWAVRLADPRSTYVGLAAGAAVMALLAARGRRAKGVVLLVTGGIAVVGYGVVLKPAIDNRPQTIRTRLYAWQYAQDLIVDAPVIGHGQGATALLSDAGAMADVLADPRALDALLLHTHNEWLETAADLGSLGLVMVLSCYVLTLLAGVRALRTLDDAGRRWLLIGLLGALSGLIVEECLDVALRVAGLPTFFFATLGLSWVLIDSGVATRQAAGPRPFWRWAAIGSAGVLGIGVAAAALWDFQGARAQYDCRLKLNQTRWGEALDDVDLARRFRLNPSRRLAAIYDQAWCRASVAQALMEEYLEAKESARRRGLELDPADLQRGQERMLQMATAGIASASEILSRTPSYFGLNRVVAACTLVYHNLAIDAGRPDLAEEYRRSAAAAMEQELQRQPYNADLLWRYLEIRPDLPVQEQLQRLVVPLQFHEVEPRFIDYVQSLARRADFAAVFEPALEAAAAAGADADPYDAQILRIAAWLEAGRGRFEEARDRAAAALSRAELSRDRFPIAYAIAHRELAHYGFLADPEDVHTALDLTVRGRSVLPDSHEAAPSRRRFDDRLAMLHLADDDEAAARTLIRNYEELKEPGRNAEIANLYFGLCQLLATLPEERLPSYYPRALARLSELAAAGFVPPQAVPTVDFMQAEQSRREGDWAGCAVHWHRAIEHGVDPEQLLSLAQESSTDPAAHNALQPLIERLHAMLCGPPEL